MPAGSVVTIGNFDGVHLGHRAILDRARQVAATVGGRVVVLTFEPHPAKVLRPGTEPPRLMDTTERVAALRQAGADEVVLLEPTPALLGQTPEQFVRQLHAQYHLRAIVEGADFRFGKDRKGDVAFLAAVGRELGFTMEVVGEVELALADLLVAPVSSSLVRWLVQYGRVADAARCLGRWYTLRGTVAQGEQRGRTIGVPTVNLNAAELGERVIPADGVYAGTAELPDGQCRPAAISIGIKPTFGKLPRVIEAHLLDFAGDLYGRPITLRLARWLRDQQRFPNLDTLKAQLARDVNQTRRLHALGLLEQLPARPVLAMT